MSSKKRDEIITAGARVFARLGYHSTTVKDVIGEAGVARATFYAYFSDKRELFLEIASGRTTEIVRILTAGIDSIIEQFEAEGAPTPDPAVLQVVLSDLIEGIFRYVRKNRGITNIFLHQMIGMDKGFTRVFNDYQEALIDQAERLVENGIRIGAMNETDCRMAAEFIISGHMYLARSFSAGSGSYNVEEMSRQFTGYQLRGLLGEAPVTPGNRKKAKEVLTGRR